MFYYFEVATALTVYGIETPANKKEEHSKCRRLQQLLPFTVLKLRLQLI